MFHELRVPVIVAPMAGGPSTPELVSRAVEAGGFGFLAAGYLSVDALRQQITETREALGENRFGVNLFVPGERADPDVRAYGERLSDAAARYGVAPGEPVWDDDDYQRKLALVIAERVPVVSFTFGAPSPADVTRLHEAGSDAVVTVTTPAEARAAVDAGANALCVQGFEAGGHRGTFTDDGVSPGGGPLHGLLAALRLIRAEVDVPLIAAGGLIHGADVAAVLAGGAVAAQLGTAFLRCPEAGTQPAHRGALVDGARATTLTRAFSGRPARGLANRFIDEHGEHAPAAYPQLHWLTKPVRGAAGKANDPEAMSLWAGQTYPLADDAPVADVLARLHQQAREAISAASARFT
ncbi:MAG: nitronate monooxygenase [Pseudonocardiaceae bacterium]|nr:nitronate monooxygenase [Pseudonocardiaceae bacterium]